MSYVAHGPQSTHPCRCKRPDGVHVCGRCRRRVWHDPGRPLVRDVEAYAVARTGGH